MAPCTCGMQRNEYGSCTCSLWRLMSSLPSSRCLNTRPVSICPGCGRTLYNLEDTIARIKAATSHLKGLKIAIMGCIVNGPGEMADADYGYVGAARGKVSLYKQKECVEKNIPEDEAVDKLLALIRENGDDPVWNAESRENV